MATVLMGWELGGGLGHVQPLLSVARELARRGHQPVFIVKDLLEAAPVLNDAGFATLQSPVWPARLTGPKGFRASSYADILAIRGFSDADALFPLVRAWHDLLALVRPALIVCDHSPTLCLAAYQTLPVVMLGTGFTVPPAEAAELPQLLPGTLPHTPQAQLLKVVETVQQRAHRPLPATLPGIFAAAARFVCTFPELDPYQAIRAQPALGPLNPLPPLREPSGPPALFVYLSADFGGVSQVLELLAKMRIPTTAFIRGAAPALVDRFTKLGIQMYATPAPIHEVLPRAAAILHHGGLLTTEEALAAGRPQVLLPRYLEQELNALAIQRMGVGTALGGQVQLQAVSQAVHQVLADPRFARQAMQWGRTVQERGPYQPLAQIVEHCQAILVS